MTKNVPSLLIQMGQTSLERDLQQDFLPKYFETSRCPTLHFMREAARRNDLSICVGLWLRGEASHSHALRLQI